MANSALSPVENFRNCTESGILGSCYLNFLPCMIVLEMMTSISRWVLNGVLGLHWEGSAVLNCPRIHAWKIEESSRFSIFVGIYFRIFNSFVLTFEVQHFCAKKFIQILRYLLCSAFSNQVLTSFLREFKSWTYGPSLVSLDCSAWVWNLSCAAGAPKS